MTNSKLNGSVQALAQALSDVVSEAVEPVRGDVKRLEKMLTDQSKHLSGTLPHVQESADKIERAADRLLAEPRH